MASSRFFIVPVAIAVVGAILSIGRSTSAGAVVFHGARPDKTCNSATACLTVDNTGGGSAIVATTKNAAASAQDTIVGITESAGRAGMLGQTYRECTSGGCYSSSGVSGEDLSSGGGNANYGVSGSSTWGIGVAGLSQNFWGMNATTYNGTAALVATTNNTSKLSHHVSFAVIATDASSDGGTLNGGLYAQSQNGFGVHAIGNPAIASVGSTSGALLFTAQSSAGATVATLDDAGNLHLSGKVLTSGSCKKGCVVGGGVTRRAADYVATESQPTIEDFGEAQLYRGRAHVVLDPAFANRIDGGSRYLVFITPEGQSRELYVANRTQEGFDVVEDDSGNSSISFAFRIVARPFGDKSARLPMENVRDSRPLIVKLPASR